MRRLIIALALATAAVLPAPIPAQSTGIAIADGAPSEYTVQRGDTLWSISGKFLKDPWQWPELWRMNRDQVRNPHRIFPGDVIRFDRSTGAISLTPSNTVRLSPGVRVSDLQQEIPSIPAGAIAPFLRYPLVVESEAKLEYAPRILGTEDRRVIVGVGNLVYADGVAESEGVNWQVYRPGRVIRDPETNESLGYEAEFLGEARVRRFGAPATLEVTKAALEINKLDFLMPLKDQQFPAYVPRPPTKPVSARILSVQEGVTELARFAVVAINRGKRDGIEIGHVLATSRLGEKVSTYRGYSEFGIPMPSPDLTWKPNPVVPDSPASAVPPPVTTEKGEVLVGDDAGRKLRANKQGWFGSNEIKLPDERNGLIFVFRVFDKVSYALVMQSKRQISVGDAVNQP